MDFQTMQTEVSDRTGIYDSAVSSDLTKIKRWINMAQQDIGGRMNWPFMLAHEIVQTVAGITTGTVSVNSASTSLTFSSAPSVSVTDWFIKLQGSDDWYKVTAHTASATSATITPAYGGSSNLSAGTYTLRKLFYATSTPLDSILDIKKTVNGRFLESYSARDRDLLAPLYFDAGEVYGYISSIPESDGDLRFSLFYSPSSVENLQVRGIKRITDLSADADVSIIPARWHSAIVDLACYYGFTAADDSRSTDSFNRAEQVIQTMMQVYSPDLGRHRVMRSITDGIPNDPAYTLPPQYGRVV